MNNLYFIQRNGNIHSWGKTHTYTFLKQSGETGHSVNNIV